MAAKFAKGNIFFILVAALMFCMELFSIWDKPLTFDEGAHAHYGLNILRGNSARFDDSKMPVSALNALPVAFAQFLQKNVFGGRLPAVFFYYGCARVPTTLFSLIVLFFIYHWTLSCYGLKPAMLSAFLFAFSPNIIAHSSLITTDAYAMGGLFFSVLSLWFFLRKRSLFRLFLFSGAVAFAMISKFSCIFIYPLCFAIFAIKYSPLLTRMFLKRKRYAMRVFAVFFLRDTIIFLAVNIFLLNSAFLFNGTFRALNAYEFKSSEFKYLSEIPLVSSLPIPLPAPFIEGMDWVQYHQSTGRNFGGIYMLGKIAPPGEGFKAYYLAAWLFKIPLPTQLLFYIAIAGYIFHKRKNSLSIFLEDEFIFFILPAFFYFFLLSFVLKAQLGLRYMLLCMPFVFVFSGRLLRAGAPENGWKKAMLFVLCSCLVISNLSYYPHYISYFNELSWNRAKNWKILADSNLNWGQSTKYLAKFAKENPAVYINPEKPVAGMVVVDVNLLTGVLCDAEKYRWLRENYEPAGHVAYSYIIFDCRK
jgi:4-amino-4-deoxy-L-arabinose transferase-like glycosyltransferase